MKTCTKCGHDKPLTDYYRQANAPDGHRARCKACLSTESRERYAKTGRAPRDEISRERRNARRREARRAAGIAPRRVGRSPKCNYPGCKAATASDGLCDTHHVEVSASRESPLDIGGRWVKTPDGLTKRWVAA